VIDLLVLGTYFCRDTGATLKVSQIVKQCPDDAEKVREVVTDIEMALGKVDRGYWITLSITKYLSNEQKV
jgi:hypothetical protein